jgi:hypothetical protein
MEGVEIGRWDLADEGKFRFGKQKAKQANN